jgi:phage tail-like protein
MPTGAGVKAFVTLRFYVEFGGETHAVFTECSGLQVEVEVQEWEEGGLNDYVHRLPGRVKYPLLVLKTGLTTSPELWKWYKKVLGGKLERKNVSVTLYDPRGERVQEWKFRNALPVKWTGPALKADENTVAIESLELAHEGLDLSR